MLKRTGKEASGTIQSIVEDAQSLRDTILSDAEINDLEVCFVEKLFSKGDILFTEGSACERIFVLKSGRIKLSRTSESGREQILEVFEPGKTCACHAGAKVWKCPGSAQALSDGSVLFLNRSDFNRLIKASPELMGKLGQMFAERLCQFCSLIEEVALQDSRSRLIKFILNVSSQYYESNDQAKNVSVPMTHDEIAQRLGMARETVTRQLNSLKRSKLIQIKDHQIVIVDQKALLAASRG